MSHILRLASGCAPKNAWLAGNAPSMNQLPRGHGACSTCCKGVAQAACAASCRHLHKCEDHGLQAGGDAHQLAGACCTCAEGPVHSRGGGSAPSLPGHAGLPNRPTQGRCSISGHCLDPSAHTGLASRQQHSSRAQCSAGSLACPAAITRPFKPTCTRCAACHSPVTDRTAPAEQQRHAAPCSGHSRRGCSGQQRACSQAALPGTRRLQPAGVACGRGY